MFVFKKKKKKKFKKLKKIEVLFQTRLCFNDTNKVNGVCSSHAPLLDGGFITKRKVGT